MIGWSLARFGSITPAAPPAPAVPDVFAAAVPLLLLLLLDELFLLSSLPPQAARNAAVAAAAPVASARRRLTRPVRPCQYPGGIVIASLLRIGEPSVPQPPL